MSPRKTRTVPVGAMITALAIIAIAAFFALFVGGDVLMEPQQDDRPAESATENQ